MTSLDEIGVRIMLKGYRGLVRPLLFGYQPEDIHQITIGVLARLPQPLLDLAEFVVGHAEHPVTLAGITFPGRVGVAAGLDKEGSATRSWVHLGFGFAELGTVTPMAQPGNPQPRLFRLPTSHGLINRMGFNNLGAQDLADRLARQGIVRGQLAAGIPLGISIGKNKVTPMAEAVEDYLSCLAVVAPHADYIAINISSPNTPGLRSLQDRASMAELTTALVRRAAELDPDDPIPLFVKLSPDLNEARLDEVIEVCEQTGVSGLIATNSTVQRPKIHPSELQLAQQAGGLSGGPLTQLSLDMVRRITGRTSLPVMGVGGIMTPADAQAMFDAGAQLVQIYTGFIYKGPALVRGINRLTVPGV